ncbi:MAG: UvrD-helicase domain-containing protein [Candidatus Sumerlaeia bacterium]|nr:UvrD-helicase domain-containing protein [Candidatus Sumerlaeia bacterium]
MSGPADLLAGLNPPQREAVTHPGGPLLIIAGAGSGKTRVITHRIAWLIREQGVSPQGVFAATFTNKAAEEMRTRVEQLLGRAHLHLPIATFHSLCARILRTDAPRVGRTGRYTIVDESDQLGLIKDVLKTLGLRAEDCPPGYAQWQINQAKMRLEGPDDMMASLPRPEDEWTVQVYRHYQRRIEESDAFDFEDLLGCVVKMLESDAERREHYQRRFGHVMVDEYQDTNAVQYRLVKLLSGSHHNLCVVGDEDQSIYSWRGADLSNILSFQSDHPGAKVVKLEQNYRSTGNILRAASAVIANNTERLGKTLWTGSGDGDPIEILRGANEHEESQRIVEEIERLQRQGVPLREMAVFYRINALSRVFEERLLEAGVPHRVYGAVRFFERREVKDLVAYLQLVANPSNAVAFLRIINMPRRGVGDKTLRQIVTLAEERGSSLWQTLRAMLGAGELKGKAATALAGFAESVETWQGLAAGGVGLPDLLQRILAETGYLEALRQSDPLGFSAREENVAALDQSLSEYQTLRPEAGLEGYLEKIALESATDGYDPGADCVSLMTLHCAKGLEFDIVFLAGLEEPIFPNRRAVEEGRGLEEERRLFYVGLTRARRRVYLCHAQSRMLHGQVQWSVPSMFLREIPPEVLAEGHAVARRPFLTPRQAQKTVAPAAPPPGESRREHRTGQRVEHGVFGVGTVLGVKGEGSLRRLVVRFEGDELVELLERYADLRLVGSD